jgi:predicted molibdopterin-dependent oxidoreductase YjgC
MAVNLDACIHCNLCVRACREVQVNDVIGMAGRGHTEKIVFDFDDPMGASTCVACGECVQACPTGALMPATMVDDNQVYKGRSTASAPIAASAASSPTRSSTTRSSPWPERMARRTRTGCA